MFEGERAACQIVEQKLSIIKITYEYQYSCYNVHTIYGMFLHAEKRG